jgi:ADP-ribosylglycohydrolase
MSAEKEVVQGAISEEIVQRSEGKTMIGAIAGDIVGSRFEWAYMKSKDFELFPPKKCSFTDDSVMTIAIAAALTDWKAGGGELHNHAIRRMQEFGRRFPHAGYGGKFGRWLESNDPQPYNSWGNGAAMRVSACGWAANSIEEAAIRNAISLGGDADTIAAIAGGVAGAYYGVPDEIRMQALQHLDPFLRDAFLGAERKLKGLYDEPA